MQTVIDWLNSHKTLILALLVAVAGVLQSQGDIPTWLTPILAALGIVSAPHTAAVKARLAAKKGN